jgi:hypothetical protein
MEEYLMIMHEVENARLSRQAPKIHQKEGPCQLLVKEQAKEEEEEEEEEEERDG